MGLKKYSYIFILLIIMAFGKVLGKFLTKGVWCSSTKMTYDDSLNIYLSSFPEIEDSLNKTPKLLDEFTSFDSATCLSAENKIIYYHTLVKNTKDDFDQEKFNSLMKNQIDSNYFNNPKMFMIRKFRTKVNHVYIDKNGELFTQINSGY